MTPWYISYGDLTVVEILRVELNWCLMQGVSLIMNCSIYFEQWALDMHNGNFNLRWFWQGIKENFLYGLKSNSFITPRFHEKLRLGGFFPVGKIDRSAKYFLLSITNE